MTTQLSVAAGGQSDSQFGEASALINYTEGSDALQRKDEVSEDDDDTPPWERPADKGETSRGALHHKAEVTLPDREVAGIDILDYVKEMTEKLIASLATETGSIFNTADLLAEADGKLKPHPDDFKKVWEKAGLRSKENVENYIRVAKAPHLRKPDILPYLPARVGTLIDLVTWSEDDIRKCIDDGVMHHDATRQDLKGWKPKRTTRKTARKQQPQPKKLVLQVYAIGDLSEADTVAVERALQQLDAEWMAAADAAAIEGGASQIRNGKTGTVRLLEPAKPRLQLARPLTPAQRYQQRLDKWNEKVIARTSALASKWIKMTVKISQDHGRDEESIKGQLANVGREHEYEGLRAEAVAKLPPPKPLKGVAFETTVRKLRPNFV